MKVLVGVCGSVAAYKAAELVRLLQGGGAEVDVAMTDSAERFITPLTFASLTGREVFTSLWNPSGAVAGSEPDGFSIEHIALSQRIDALVVAPATAATLSRFAHGLATDFLSTLYLATRAPVFVAPAMNVLMWQHPATQQNLSLLQQRGVEVLQPEEGYLACGMTGSGRLLSPESIAHAVLSAGSSAQSLAGETVLVTAGGTRERIDPVRFLGNRSSGKMGYALAEEARRRGAHVILVTASSLPVPSGCTAIPVETAAEMRDAVLRCLPDATVVIKAAAVADFRLSAPSAGKLHRDGLLRLELEPTPDIVAEVVRKRKPGTLVIGFAAETENLQGNARSKLLRKGLDAIVANDVSEPGFGFDSDRNRGLVITPEATVPLPEESKRDMARRILTEVEKLRQAMPALL